MTMPRPRYNSLPAPGFNTSGIRPKIVVPVVIMIGRMRVRVDSTIAWWASRPLPHEVDRLLHNQNGVIDNAAQQNDKTQHGQNVPGTESFPGLMIPR